jgi:ADP-ribose pyrophosphatase YjhB (NUDIX family)
MITNYHKTRCDIHVISRAVITQGDKILLCNIKGKKWYFLPGGHIDNGESSRQALLRELEEEVGPNDYKIEEMIGVCETVFDIDENTKQHEVDLVFSVTVSDNFIDLHKKEHIEFSFHDKKDLESLKVLPEHLKLGILSWVKDGKFMELPIQ